LDPDCHFTWVHHQHHQTRGVIQHWDHQSGNSSLCKLEYLKWIFKIERDLNNYLVSKRFYLHFLDCVVIDQFLVSSIQPHPSNQARQSTNYFSVYNLTLKFFLYLSKEFILVNLFFKITISSHLVQSLKLVLASPVAWFTMIT
jgi:hypothetical protein